jgi:hypothetical protein
MGHVAKTSLTAVFYYAQAMNIISQLTITVPADLTQGSEFDPPCQTNSEFPISLYFYIDRRDLETRRH